MATPTKLENYVPAVKQAGAVQSALPFKIGGVAASPTITSGTGAPSASLPKGSLYLRLDGSSTSTRVYVATDSAGTWTNVTTAT